MRITPKLDRLTGLLLADGDLERAAVNDLLAVHGLDDVALLQAGVSCGRVGCDLSDDGARGVLEVEELGVLGGYVVHRDAEVAVLHLAVCDELLRGGLCDLRRDGKAGAGEGAGVRDDEGVDADELAVGVDEGAAGVAGIDGGVGLDEAAGLAGVVAVGVLPVDGARRCRG